MKKQLLATLIGLNITAAAQAATPSTDEMWAIIQQQQEQIATLVEQLSQNNSRLSETEIF
jgi:malonyl CoA-acyl carrier protein transacylase